MSKVGNGKSLKDFRYRYVRGLIGLEHFQRERHFMKQAAECTSKAIVSLELAEKPVKTVRQAQKLEGIGVELGKKLSQVEGSLTISASPPAEGMFISSAGALLAAMVICADQIQQEKQAAEGLVLVPETMLRETACQLCEESMDAKGSESVFCPAWWRLTVLVSRGLLKRRSQNKLPVYELLPKGEEVAQRIMAQTGIRKLDSRPPPRPVEENNFHNNQLRALYTNDEGGDGIVLIVDTQEWGGDRVGLDQLCDLLDRSGIRYRTQKLPLGDYVWVWQCGQQEILLPMMVERKRVDDLARSLVDGRYTKQKERMVEWKCRVLPDAPDVSLKYIVEGQADDYVVRCRDGCGAVLKCGYPTAEQIQTVLEEVHSSEDFDLIQTDNIHGTVNLFKVMTNDLQKRLNDGEFYGLLDLNMDIEGTMAGLQTRVKEPEAEKDEDSPPGSPDVHVPDTDANENHLKSYSPKPLKPRPLNLAHIPLSQYHSSPALAARTFSDSKPIKDKKPPDVPKNHLPVKTAINKSNQKKAASASSSAETGDNGDNRVSAGVDITPQKKQNKRIGEKSSSRKRKVDKFDKKEVKLDIPKPEPKAIDCVVIDDSDSEESNDQSEVKPVDFLELQKALLEKFNKEKAAKSVAVNDVDQSASTGKSFHSDTIDDEVIELSSKSRATKAVKPKDTKPVVDDAKPGCSYVDVNHYDPDDDSLGSEDMSGESGFCIFSLSKKSKSPNLSTKRKNMEKRTDTRKRRKTPTVNESSECEPSVKLNRQLDNDQSVNIHDIDEDLIPDIVVPKTDDPLPLRKRLNLNRNCDLTSIVNCDEDDELPDINFVSPVPLKRPKINGDNKDFSDPVPSTSAAYYRDHGAGTDAVPSISVEDYSEQVQQVQMVLPSVDVEIIRNKLTTYSGDVDHVINCLLDS